jgi:hypothetical protein
VQLDKPNFEMVLAPSYNHRGTTDSFGVTVDQSKVNMIYVALANSATGKATLYLAKRPGYANNGNTYGTATSQYLVTAAGAVAGGFWVIDRNAGDTATRASDSSGTTQIVADAYYPHFIDHTLISGVDTVVLQTFNTSVAMKVWYASARNSWSQITDADFTALTPKGKMEHLDGFAFQMTSDNKIYNSDLNSLANWTATNYLQKQIQQDSAAGLAKFKNQILAFGAGSMEVFYNAGNATASPLGPVIQLQQKIGLFSNEALAGGTHYYAIAGEKLYFVSTATPSGSVYAWDGARMERVSNRAIEALISSSTQYSVNCLRVAGMEAISIGTVSPIDSAAQSWLVFIPSLNEWFEWNSTVISPVQAQGAVSGQGTVTVHLSAATGGAAKLYSPADGVFWAGNVYTDDGGNYTSSVQFRLPRNGNQRHFMRFAGVHGDTARSAQSLSIQFSDDDDQNFQTARTIDMTAQKKHIYRCGSYQGDRTVKLSYTGSLDLRLEKFLARID